MVLEQAMLKLPEAREAEFEAAFSEAKTIISSMPGFVSLRLERSIEQRGHYALLVEWEKLEDHTIGFRQSQQYEQWRALLHHFYEEPPAVQHFTQVFKA